MAATIAHRGPDDESFSLGDNFGFAFRRLSIIDLQTGRQPITNEDETVWLMVNGEIYNYKVLRANLERHGHVFKSHSDIEVIVHLYEDVGERAFEHLDGMFAIALYDTKTQTLLLARDRLGKKPLYYSNFNNTMVFGSEIKALLAYPSIPRELDNNSVSLYCAYEFVPTPHSIFKGIQKLEPGHYLKYQNDTISIDKFWDIAAVLSAPLESEQEIITRLDGLFAQAVCERLMSDVPLGVFLSGGIDSSAIAYYAQQASSAPIYTFTLGFSEVSFDESKYARLVANFLGTRHLEIKLSVHDALGLFDDAAQLMDEPLGDAQVLPSLLLSRFTKRQVSVVLGGDGSDELFLGYQHFPAHAASRLLQYVPRGVRAMAEEISARIPVGSGYFSLGFVIQRFFKGQGLKLNSFERDLVWRGSFAPYQQQELFHPHFYRQINPQSAFDEIEKRITEVGGNHWLDVLSRIYLKQYLMDDCMTMVDRTSMRYGLEVRAPFQDYQLVEFVLGLRTNMKMRNFKGKYIFKKLLKDKLPNQIIHRKKKGFAIPTAQWLRNELRGVADDLFSPSFLAQQGIFNKTYVRRLYEQHLSGKKDFRKELWTLLMFQLWYTRWLKR